MFQCRGQTQLLTIYPFQGTGATHQTQECESEGGAAQVTNGSVLSSSQKLPTVFYLCFQCYIKLGENCIIPRMA